MKRMNCIHCGHNLSNITQTVWDYGYNEWAIQSIFHLNARNFYYMLRIPIESTKSSIYSTEHYTKEFPIKFLFRFVSDLICVVRICLRCGQVSIPFPRMHWNLLNLKGTFCCTKAHSKRNRIKMNGMCREYAMRESFLEKKTIELHFTSTCLHYIHHTSPIRKPDREREGGGEREIKQ